MLGLRVVDWGGALACEIELALLCATAEDLVLNQDLGMRKCHLRHWAIAERSPSWEGTDLQCSRFQRRALEVDGSLRE